MKRGGSVAHNKEGSVQANSRQVDTKLVEITRRLESVNPPKCNCVSYYRESIAWRWLVFKLYRKEGKFSFGHFVGLMTWLEAASDLRFQELRANPIPAYLWNLWAELKLKLAGHPPADTTLLLYFSALLLWGCPNAYTHLLRDALRLRLGRYGTRLERQIRLKDCVKWAEGTCKRVWLTIYNREPQKCERDWWLRTARTERLLLSRAEGN